MTLKREMKYVLIILASLAVLSCQESDLKNMGAVQSDILPDEVSRDVHLVYSDSGRVKFIIDAPLIHKYIKDTVYTEFPEGVHTQFYAKDGSKTSDLKAGYYVIQVTAGIQQFSKSFIKN